jgi:hypothetical protein
MGTKSLGHDRKKLGGLPRVGLLSLRTRARRPITEAVWKMIIDKFCKLSK